MGAENSKDPRTEVVHTNVQLQLGGSLVSGEYLSCKGSLVQKN